MSRSSLLLAIPLLVLFVCPKPAEAIPPKGKFSLSAKFPGGGDPITGGAGVWWMVARRINLGLSFNFVFQDELNDIQFGPAIRYYLGGGPVAPFLYGELDTTLKTGGDNNDDTKIHALLGFGAEWFINRSVSIAVFTGLSVRNLVGDADSKITTMTSGLTAQFYFSSL